MKLGHIILWHMVASMVLFGLYSASLMIWPELDAHRDFTLYTAATFLFLSIFITTSSERVSDHQNPYYFSWITLMSVLVKLGVGIGLVVYYTKTNNLDNRLYVISFILAYVVYTACEVWLLQRIIKSVKKPWNK